MFPPWSNGESCEGRRQRILDCRPGQAFTLIAMSRRIEAAQEPLGRHLGSAQALELRERAHALIPGGAHTYAKGDDQFPELAPALIARGAGCRVWDTDGNEFIEYGMGLRAVTLGHALSGGRRGRAPPDAARHELHAAGADRARGGRGACWTSSRRPRWSSSARTARRRTRPRSRSRAPTPAAISSRSAPTTRSSPTTTGSSARLRCPPASRRRSGT